MYSSTLSCGEPSSFFKITSIFPLSSPPRFVNPSATDVITSPRLNSVFPGSFIPKISIVYPVNKFLSICVKLPVYALSFISFKPLYL